jgi:hypothetical protein
MHPNPDAVRKRSQARRRRCIHRQSSTEPPRCAFLKGIVTSAATARALCHVSGHADEAGGTIAAMALRRQRGAAADDRIGRNHVPANHMFRSAGVEDSVICLIGVVGVSGSSAEWGAAASSGEDLFASRPIVVAASS